MKRNPSKVGAFLLASALACSWSPAWAQSVNGVADGAAFLLIPIGGRASALGQAAIADGGDSEAAFWNPAGLARLTVGEVAAHHAKTFISDNTALAAYFKVGGSSTMGLSAYLVDYGAQDATVGDGLVTGRFSPRNIQLLASYATDLGGGVAFGVNYKLIQLRQDCSGDCGAFPSTVGTTHGVDVGVQYSPNSLPISFGAALRHAGFRLQLQDLDQADPLPTRLDVGVVYVIALPELDPDAEPLDARILLDLQNRLNDPGIPEMRLGAEVGYGDLLRLRTGYAFISGESAGPSVGLGVKLGKLAVDFARLFYVSSNFDSPYFVSIRAGL